MRETHPLARRGDGIACRTRKRSTASSTVERIAAEARQRMWQLGREGGYFCGPDQGLPFPPEHIDALNRTIEQHGRYPLSPPDS